MSCVFLVSCGRKKTGRRTSAADLYISSRFTKTRELIQSIGGCSWFILSAKHGLLDPDAMIDPYDKTLNTMSAEARKQWARGVQQQMDDRLPEADRLVILAGKPYYEHLMPYLKRRFLAAEIPLQGMRQGEQLNWLNKALIRSSALETFYALLDELEASIGGKRRLGDCNDKMDWPERGVYFFFDPGETRESDPACLRVVRVGTHALKAGANTTLWNRINQHQGTLAPRGGNHRSSIFRLLVGEALGKRYPKLIPESWGSGSTAPQEVREAEMEFEARVSDYMREMSLLFVAVHDNPGPQSMRGTIERNAIALLTGYSHALKFTPFSEWLGKDSSHSSVALSGLWNDRHVGEKLDPNFVSGFANLVRKMDDFSRKSSRPGKSKNTDDLQGLIKVTASAEQIAWAPDKQKIQVLPEPMKEEDLWTVTLDKLRDENNAIKDNPALSNTHASLVDSVIQWLDDKLVRYSDSPQRIHDEIDRALLVMRQLEEDEYIPSGHAATIGYRKTLEDCLLDIRGDMPAVQLVVERRAALRLTQLSDEKQQLLISVTDEVVPFIEDERIREDMKEDVEALQETQDNVDLPDRVSRIYRWSSRISRMIEMLQEHVMDFSKRLEKIVKTASNFVEKIFVGVSGNVIAKIILKFLSLD